jgi:hypothetical protein
MPAGIQITVDCRLRTAFVLGSVVVSVSALGRPSVFGIQGRNVADRSPVRVERINCRRFRQEERCCIEQVPSFIVRHAAVIVVPAETDMS